jgi:hypothetical protein
VCGPAHILRVEVAPASPRVFDGASRITAPGHGAVLPHRSNRANVTVHSPIIAGVSVALRERGHRHGLRQTWRIVMPKYLFQATYSAEGIKGLEKDKAVGRKAALSKAVESLERQAGSPILGVW